MSQLASIELKDAFLYTNKIYTYAHSLEFIYLIYIYTNMFYYRNFLTIYY